MNRDDIDALILEYGLNPANFNEVADLLATAAAVPTPAPRPSPALAQLIGAPARVPAQRRRHRGAAIIGGGSLALVLALSGAAAANLLPRPVQEFFHDVTEGGLPIEFPAPPTRSDDESPEYAPSPTLAPRTSIPSSTGMTLPSGNGVTPSIASEEPRPATIPATPPAGVPVEAPGDVADDGRTLDTPAEASPTPAGASTVPAPIPDVAPTPTRPGGQPPTGEPRTTGDQTASTFTDGSDTRRGGP